LESKKQVNLHLNFR